MSGIRATLELTDIKFYAIKSSQCLKVCELAEMIAISESANNRVPSSNI